MRLVSVGGLRRDVLSRRYESSTSGCQSSQPLGGKAVINSRGLISPNGRPSWREAILLLMGSAVPAVSDR